ncbi:MAG: ABC transporter substrate-binding protein [candidate division WOR-3 bacterium]
MKGGRRGVVLTLVSMLFVSLSFLLPLGFCEEKSQPTPTLRVGGLLALTGWFSAAGLGERDECYTVLEMINEKGVKIGDKLYKLELIIEDTQSTHEGVVTATNKLVYDKKVKFIIGPNAFWGPASAPICESNKILNIIGYCTNTPGELDKSTKYRILAENGTVGHVYATIKYIKAKHPEIKTVVMVHPDDGTIPYHKNLIKKALADHGIAMVGDVISFSNELVDFTPIAMKINRVKADAVLIPNAIGKHVGSILKGLRERGDERWVFYSGVAKMEDILQYSGKAAGRKVVSHGIYSEAEDNPPQLKEFLSRYYKKRGGVTPVVLQNSVALYILPQILEATQSLEPDTIMKNLAKVERVETLWGPGVLCGAKTYGVRNAIAHPLPVQYLDEKGEFKYGGWIKDIYVP